MHILVLTQTNISLYTNFDASPSCLLEGAFGPPKWVLVLMTRTIKKLMCLSSNEQVQKSLKWETTFNDAIFAKETMFELH